MAKSAHGRIHLKPSSVRLLLLSVCVTCAVSGCGGGGSGSHTPSTIQLTPEQASAYLDAGDQAAQVYEEEEPTSGPEQAMQRALEALRQSPDVRSAGVTPDGTTLWFEMTSGAVGYVVTVLPPAEGHTADTSQERSACLSSRASLPMQTGPQVFEAPNPGPAKVMIAWSPNLTLERTRICEALGRVGYGADEVEVVTEDDVTPEQFRNLTRYSLVYFSGHGRLDREGHPLLITGEKVVDYEAVVTFTPFWPVVFLPQERYRAVGADYLRAVNPEGFRRTVAFLFACHSLADESFPSVFGPTCLVLGFRGFVVWPVNVEATTATLKVFAEQGTGGEARRVWEQYKGEWQAQDGRRYSYQARTVGSDTVCLVANLVGSWLGNLEPPPANRNPTVGLRLFQYNREGIVGQVAYHRVESEFSGRGLSFEFKAPKDDLDERYRATLTRDDELLAAPCTPTSGLGSWRGRRISPSPNYDTVPPRLVSHSPETGTDVPNSFTVELKWSEPMYEHIVQDLVVENGRLHFDPDGWIQPDPRTFRQRLDVWADDARFPAVITWRVHHMYDVWGNPCSNPEATLTWYLPPDQTIATRATATTAARPRRRH